MANYSTWQEVLAGFKALYDLLKSGSDYSTSYRKYQRDPVLYAETLRVTGKFSTHSAEMRALIRDIEACRDRIMSEGGSTDRTKCLCSIFNRIKEGNAGTMPLIDGWQSMYDELGCASTD